MNYEEEIKEVMETEAEGFKVDNDALASWCLKVIKAEKEETERLKKIADEQIEELLAKKDALDNAYVKRTSYLTGKLYEYFNTVPHKETKTQQSYKLLDGSLVYKKPVAKIVKPEDDTALLIYLKANAPEYIETKENIKWGDYKKQLSISDNGEIIDTASGEVLSFMQTEESEGSFDVKVW